MDLGRSPASPSVFSNGNSAPLPVPSKSSMREPRTLGAGSAFCRFPPLFAEAQRDWQKLFYFFHV